MTNRACLHDFVYSGGVNVAINGIIDGTIDVWSCERCGAQDYLGRGPGVTEPPNHVGFQPLGPNEKYVVLVCRQGRQPAWETFRARPGDTVKCSCEDPIEPSSYRVSKEFTLEAVDAPVRPRFHELFLVEDWMNETIDL